MGSSDRLRHAISHKCAPWKMTLLFHFLCIQHYLEVPFLQKVWREPFLFCNYHLLLLTSASNSTLEENTWGTAFSRRTWEIGDKKLCHNYSHHTLFCHKYVTTSKDYYTKVCYDDNKKAVISEGALQLEQSRESCKSPLISFFSLHEINVFLTSQVKAYLWGCHHNQSFSFR